MRSHSSTQSPKLTLFPVSSFVDIPLCRKKENTNQSYFTNLFNQNLTCDMKQHKEHYYYIFLLVLGISHERS